MVSAWRERESKKEGGKGRMKGGMDGHTLFRLSRRSAYSSRTSCSRGIQAVVVDWSEGGGGGSAIWIVG